MFVHPPSSVWRRPAAAHRAAEREFALNARLVRKSAEPAARRLCAHREAARRTRANCVNSLAWACHLLNDDELRQALRREASVELAAFGFIAVRPPAVVQAGDLVLYFQGRVVCHAGVGRPGERVESKRCEHAVYVHAADAVPWAEVFIVYRRRDVWGRKQSHHEYARARRGARAGLDTMPRGTAASASNGKRWHQPRMALFAFFWQKLFPPCAATTHFARRYPMRCGAHEAGGAHGTRGQPRMALFAFFLQQLFSPYAGTTHFALHGGALSDAVRCV